MQSDEANSAASEREALLASLLASVNDLVWCTNLDGSELLYINEAAAKIYGIPPGDVAMAQTAWLDAIHPGDRARVEKNLSQLRERGKIRQDYRIIRPDGEVRWLQDRIHIIYEDGKPVRVGGIATDVTDLKRTELSARQTYAFLDSIVENIPIMLFLKEPTDLRYVRVNRAGEEMLGYTRDEMIGETAADFLPPDAAERITQTDRAVLDTRQMIDVEEREIDTPHRGTRTFHTRKLPILDEQGNLQFLLGIAQDITERKLAQEALQEAKEVAEAANRAKSGFLANMSHEIRTPLNGIIGITELLLESDLTAQQRDYLTMVRESGDALLQLINDILDFSKIEAGHLRLVNAPFLIKDRISDLMRSLSIRAHGKGLELILRIDSAVPAVVVGDIVRLRQVLVNLIGNAIKFTDEGEVELLLRCRQESNRVFLEFTVRDTGVGIAEADQPTVFEEFEQAHETANRRYGGTGLGLAICKRLVELMGGRIWIESTPGRGTSFHFTSIAELVTEESPLLAAPPYRLEQRHILVVEDSVVHRDAIEALLSHAGASVVPAGNVAQALHQLREMPNEHALPDAIVVDAYLPDGDAHTLANSLHDDPELAAIPVIVLTTAAWRGDAEQSAGIVAHVLKPVKESELLETIARAVGIVPSAELSLPGPAEPSAGQSLRILLAEDNPVNQTLALGILAKDNHRVTVASTGPQALAQLEQQEFDVVLMDVQMPELNGIETTRRIRENEQTRGKRRVPIVAMTAYALEDDRQRCLDAGMDDYLSKPIRGEQLRQLLVEVTSPATDDKKASHRSRVPANQSEQIPDANEIDRPMPAERRDARSLAPTSNSQSESFDWSHALRTVRHNEQLLRDVLHVFLEDTPRLMRELQSAIAERVPQRVRLHAHSLKGALLFLGPSTCQSLAKELEMRATDDDLSTADELYETLQREMKALTLRISRQ